jgi:RimJ/RimL family protein N-acetyltransferase
MDGMRSAIQTWHLLEKAGFELEGMLRSHHFRDGKPDDVLFFGMMRPA